MCQVIKHNLIKMVRYYFNVSNFKLMKFRVRYNTGKLKVPKTMYGCKV